VRVALADDSGLFREALALLLSTAQVQVIAQAATGPELLTRLRHTRPDVAILDIRMPPTFTDEGLKLAEELRAKYENLGILILSAYAETADAARVIEIDSRRIGYLLKDRVTDIHTLIDALERIAQGEAVLDPEIIRRVLARKHETDLFESLTQREQQILTLMAEGRSNAGIARVLSIHPRTVEAPISEIFNKLGIHRTTDDNRRVLAVLTWLRGAGNQPNS
jgi:DNA-binding NarL/FixJ family response regulator